MNLIGLIANYYVSEVCHLFRWSCLLMYDPHILSLLLTCHTVLLQCLVAPTVHAKRHFVLAKLTRLN